MKSILITGSEGQLGSELQELVRNNYLKGYKYIFTDVAQLNIGNKKEVLDFFQKEDIAYCINCAAYTAVDKAESDIENAILVNVTGVENLAEACSRFSIKFLHISTDYVYHNNQNTPFKEDDETNPHSVYGLTKLQGEKKATETWSDTMIIRTSWVYSSYGNNFVKTMLKLGKERPQLNVIFDQIGSPTYAADLAKAILDIIRLNDSGNVPLWSGIYHYSNEGVCSWYDFAKAIFELNNVSLKVYPIETKDYPTPAKRPYFSLLNKSKIKADFGLKIPYWRDSLKECLERLKL